MHTEYGWAGMFGKEPPGIRPDIPKSENLQLGG